VEKKMPRRAGARIPAGYVVLALLATVLLAACGSALVETREDVMPAAHVDLELSAQNWKSAPDTDAVGALAPLPMPAPAEAANAARVDDALIVRTASLELEVEDVAATLLDARAEIAGLGGYVSGSDEYDQGERRWASVTYRVPVARFSDALDALRGLSTRVVRESTQSQEVTATVVDLDARIANLRASEEALVEIMDRSGRIEDVLAVQMRLEDVRGQIERLEAQRKNLADQAALSTLTVSWFTPVAAVTAAQEGWSLAAEVDAALAQTVEALQGVASFGVWFVFVPLPLLGLPLLLMAILFLAVRRRFRPGQGDDPGPGAPAPTPAE
jgi:hypothetical protein